MGLTNVTETLRYARETTNSQGNFAANSVLARYIVPAGKELEFFNMRAYVATSANADGATPATIKLCDSAANVIASVSVSGKSGSVFEAGAANTVAGRLTTSSGIYSGQDTCIYLTNGTSNINSFVGTVQVDFNYPGAQ